MACRGTHSTPLSLLGIAAAATTGAAQSLQPIALSGVQAPGVEPGITFARLSPPSLAASGDIVFFATLAGDGLPAETDEALFRLRTGTLELVVRESDPAPWYTPDTRFVGLSDYAIDAAGNTVLAASVDDPAVTDNAAKARALGIFTEAAPQSFVALARIDDQAAGLPDGDLYETLNSPTVDADGAALFTGGRPDENEGFDSVPKGLWSDRAGAVALLLTPGDAAPGTDGAVFAHFETPVPGTGGDFAFRGSAKPDGSTDRADAGIWAFRAGALDAVALGGDPATGTTARFETFPNRPTINAAGTVLFHATLDSPDPEIDSGLWIDRAGALALFIREGDAAPGTDAATIAEISPHAMMTDAGDIVFRCALRDADNNTNGAIYLARADGAFELLALEGDGVLDEPGDVAVATLGDPVRNERGDVLVRATLTGDAVTPDSNLALLAIDNAGRLFSVVREGDAVDPDGQGDRTVRSIVADTSAFACGRDTLDDTGRAGFALTFTDATSGVFVSALVYVSPADLTGDGLVDSRDFIAFLNFWNAQDPAADFDRNGVIDSRDLTAFLNVWSRDRS